MASPAPSTPSVLHQNALDRAARYYREALKHIIEECGNDQPRIEHIREAAESGIRAADYELANWHRVEK